MTETQYNELVSMLIRATKEQKIKWAELQNGYRTQINECPITLRNYYDSSVGFSGYTLLLSNKEGKVFGTSDKAETIDGDEYNQLDLLFHAVRDSILHITASETSIMNGLKAILDI